MERLVKDFIAAYERADATTRAERADRAAWMAQLGWPESGWTFFGDYGVIVPWDELRRTFIDGEYLAAILVGQAFLENLLAGLLDFQQESLGPRPELADVLRRARDQGWLTPQEFDVLDAVRRMRNPYAHYRTFEHADGLIQRAMAAEEAPDALIEADARAVVKALYHLVNRRPFALGPIVYPPDEGLTIHPNQMRLPF